MSFYTIVWASDRLVSHDDFNEDLKREDKTELVAPDDTTKSASATDSLKFPFNDSPSPFGENSNRSVFLKNPSNINTEFVYNPKTGNYEYIQKIGDKYYRPPTYMTFKEYTEYQIDKSNKDFWRNKTKSENAPETKSIIPKILVGGEIFDRIFGGNTVDIKPQGTAEISFALQSNKIDNPAIPEKQRRQSTFAFDQRIQLNVIGNVGEKLKLITSYNTEATFDFENQMKMEYTGYEDEIIKKIEAGNVNLPLTGTLITGSQSLFGIKTQMQFGRLTATSVFSQQRGKKQEIETSGGAQTTNFSITADNYEYNKHFFLANYFYNNFDKSMEGLPIIASTVNITRIEVWVTNTNSSATTNTRDVVGFMDLGEHQTFSPKFVATSNDTLPDNATNSLYAKYKTQSKIRNFASASTYLNQTAGLQYASDFDIAQRARLLTPSEYTFHPQLGFISLNQALNPDQVLGVAFQYSIGGSDVIHQVGEFSIDGVPDGQALIVKLLKSTNLNVGIPLWKLMMKNIYSLGAFNINQEGFRLNILYNSIQQGNDVNYLSEGEIKGKPLVQVLNMDRLNIQSDLKPDGIFDFLPGRTINPTNGRIMFPVVEPFGNHLRKKITNGDPNLNAMANKYVYDALYDTTKTAAQQRPDLNRFKLKGTYQSSSSSEISLNAFNIPKGSVVVTAGGVPLSEGTDYTVDYNMGRVKIINQSLIESNTKIKVAMENNALFGLQQKSLFGTHFDYKINNDFNLGATVVNLSERPLTQKVNMGDEPISNTIWGLDGNYRSDVPFLTKLVDKLPFLSTKEMSSITYAGEFAQLLPGNNSAIGKNGVSYIDDFEATQTIIDIRSQNSWMLASTPSKQPQLFPEGDLVNDLRYGFNRSKLAWYTIDPSVFFRGTSLLPAHLKGSPVLSNHYSREVAETEIFPNRVPVGGMVTNMPVLDLAYYPSERGPYNYDVGASNYSSGIDADGFLKNPKSRWAGIMRKIDNTDFVTQNIAYIQFWMMDPFHPDNGIDQENGVYNHKGGDLYFNLGNISEDILRDDAKSFENGLPASSDQTNLDSTAWGRISRLQSLVFAFDNNPEARKYQDIGFDGLNDVEEKTFFNDSYLKKIEALYGSNSQAFQNAIQDPSADNFHYFRGSDFDRDKKGILDRYKNFNGVEGNSSTSANSPEAYPTASSSIPNMEDINRDNTLNSNESYYQYRVSLRPQDMIVGKNNITDKVRGVGKTADGKTIDVDWYQVKIPIRNPEKTIGNIQDFNSIRFIRMFLKGFEQPVVTRFGRLEFVRGDWRKYEFDIDAPGEYIATDESKTYFDIGAVNIEENGTKTPINYVLPPNLARQVDVGTSNLRKLNEQSMVLKVCDLADGQARAAYKNTNLDVRSYKKLQMYVHAEALGNTEMVKDGDLSLFIRMGRDFSEDYYEYEIPLKISPAGRYDGESDDQRRIVWPDLNNIEIAFDELTQIKLERNKSNTAHNQLYKKQLGKGVATVLGNPNFTAVATVMVGIRNNKKQGTADGDDGLSKCAEIWVNELRLSDFDKNSGWAANSRITAKLADFGSVTVSGNMSTPGFGGVEKKISDRQRTTNKQYDISSNFELGKILPNELNLKVPVFMGYSEAFIDPQYDPNDPDILFAEKLNKYEGDPEAQKLIKEISQDYTRRKSLNFTNVKKEKGKGAKSYFFGIENFALTYSYNELLKRDINTKNNTTKTYKGLITYNYSINAKNYTPFANIKLLSKTKYAKPIQDINFYLLPNKFSFSNSLDRFFNINEIRNTSSNDIAINATYSKNITMNRMYEFRHDFTKNLKFDYTANNNSRVFEPDGPLDTQEKKDSVWNNIAKLGINTNYNQNANLNYTVPFSSFPLTDWITASAKYGTTYDWNRAPFAADSLGGVIKNSNSKQVNGQLNMTTLYNKVPYFKKISQPAKKNAKGKNEPPKTKKIKVSYKKSKVKLRLGVRKKIKHKLGAPDVTLKIKDKEGKDVEGEIEVINDRKLYFTPSRDADSASILVEAEKEKKEVDLGTIPNGIIGAVLSVKNVSGSYTKNEGTILPGYNDSTFLFGLDRDFQNPGLGFVFGQQYPNFAEKAGRDSMLVKQSLLNTAFARTMSENYNMRATVEPFKDLKIELNGSKNVSQSNSMFYRWKPDSLNPDVGSYQINSPIETGNFSISYSTFRTAFTKDNDDNSSDVYKQFLENRAEISKRLHDKKGDNSGVDSAGYYSGYGANSQNVLIPAFLSAYSKTSTSLISLSDMPAIPLPNWRITYSGLSRFDFFKSKFKSISIGHGYRSTYNIANYTSNLKFVNDGSGNTNVRDLNNNYIAAKQITQVSISEQFSPLINIDATWNNSLITKVEFKKDRTLALNFADSKLQEIQGKEIVIGSGYRFQQVPFPIKLGPAKATIKSDLNLRCDVSIRNNRTVMRSIDGSNQATAGQNVISIKTGADYVINERLNLRLFFDKIITTPVISTSFPSSNTNAGFSIRFTLS